MTIPSRRKIRFAGANGGIGRASKSGLLSRQKLIEGWHEGCLHPGQEIAAALAQRLEAAEILILLVSADLFASEQGYKLLNEALRGTFDVLTAAGAAALKFRINTAA